MWKRLFYHICSLLSVQNIFLNQIKLVIKLALPLIQAQCNRNAGEGHRRCNVNIAAQPNRGALSVLDGFLNILKG